MCISQQHIHQQQQQQTKEIFGIYRLYCQSNNFQSGKQKQNKITIITTDTRYTFISILSVLKCYLFHGSKRYFIIFLFNSSKLTSYLEIAFDVNLPKLNHDVCSKVSSGVESELKKIIEQSIKYQKRTKKNKLLGTSLHLYLNMFTYLAMIS
jgi:hypothetical protein